ncbi:MAG: acyl-CoA dehydrogenase C-terminal domain-containing protein [Pseudomonadota bacterium]
MSHYAAPIDDMKFALRELVDTNALAEIDRFAEIDTELEDAILEEAGKFCAEVLAPLNGPGDAHGCTWNDGVVTTPPGFKEAYAGLVEGGWTTLSAAPEHGGQGLPARVSLLVDEMMIATNMAFSMTPGLTLGAYHAIAAHASDELKARYLPKMVSGEWSGTMCLTEPHCGTDLGLLRTRAEPQADSSYKLTGTKIFISAGEHDLTDNIIHLVLARLPDSPKGVHGISLFVVPKFALDSDGNPSGRNGVVCGAIEEKMGIHGSPTCVINFDEATGYLVGTENHGMRQMFTMMNAARLGVGNQGIGLTEAAYQKAVAYARERLQGRALKGAAHPDKSADPIIVHPDVRRMLLTMRASVEGGRGLAMWIATELDISHHHPDPERRREADDFVQLMTPIVKAYCTDLGLDCANLGIQIMGGHGYVRDHGMEQLSRDARITQIYEGTNGIQALDLVGRKLGAHTGRYLRGFFHPVEAFLSEHADNEALDGIVQPVAKSFGRLQRATAYLAESGLNDPDEAAAAATDYLKLFGLTAFGYVWARAALVASRRQEDPTGFYADKLATARFFAARILPGSSAAFGALMAGAGSIMDFREEAF